MDPELQKSADEKLEARLRDSNVPDPREGYRELMRALKAARPEAYEEAVARFREEVVEAIVRAGRDPLEAWIAFGHSVARALHPGRTVAVDATGRSAPCETPATPDALVLHLPDEKKARAVPIAVPADPSAAQRAALDLLVEGKVRLSGA